jgi:hypothetical protein
VRNISGRDVRVRVQGTPCEDRTIQRMVMRSFFRCIVDAWFGTQGPVLDLSISYPPVGLTPASEPLKL